jgi:hypothetical protein
VLTLLALFSVSLPVNAALVLLAALPFKWLWNVTLPAIFSLPHLDYVQSAGLLGLIAIVQITVKGVEIRAKLRE